MGAPSGSGRQEFLSSSTAQACSTKPVSPRWRTLPGRTTPRLVNVKSHWDAGWKLSEWSSLNSPGLVPPCRPSFASICPRQSLHAIRQSLMDGVSLVPRCCDVSEARCEVNFSMKTSLCSKLRTMSFLRTCQGQCTGKVHRVDSVEQTRQTISGGR
ncbi:hypothetical protein BC826DRAFT_79586 [Russula brevipes]|nr:hypothetical protein BC826DRAFT_79586 [Russula brevipes]